MFPNPHDVYIHDTPDKDLFERPQRAFSSGCVRTQDAIDLAAWLLEETPEWDRARIDAVLESGAATEVDLAAPVPVHVLYFTAVPDGDGGVRYLDDLYGRDPAILNALEGAAAPADETSPES
jgi:murein L,D-transpeptidase YcbB/YkuD